LPVIRQLICCAIAKAGGHLAISTDTASELVNALTSSGEPADHLGAWALHHCLSQIESDARDCVVLSFCEGYSHSELQQRYDRPLGTIKSWIRRALASLQECMREHV